MEADCDALRDMVNNQLIPRMIRHGFPLQGIHFEWDYSEDYTPEQQVAYEQLVLDNYEVDPSYFEEKYSMPVGERRQQSTALEPQNPKGTRKKSNRAQSKRLFRLSPSTYEGLHERYARLLGKEALQNTFSREEEIREELSRLFEGMMQTIYKVEGAQFQIEIVEKPKIQNFIKAHAEVLDASFEKVEMSDTMRKRLQRSDYIFSGIKTFHELKEAFPSLLDENGNRKPVMS